MEKKKEIATITQDTGYLEQTTNLQELLSEELDGLNLTFNRIKVPGAGSLAFEVPGDDADSPDIVKEFSAVILYHHPISVFYKEKFDGNNNPPDCSSMNGVTGISHDGEITQCDKCPLSKFGSDGGKGKACKQKRRIYLLRKGEQFPTILTLPTGSLGEFSKYIMRVLNKGKKSNQVSTRFSLKKAQNSTGINYSQAVFAIDRELSHEESAYVAQMTEQVKGIANRIETIDAEEQE